MNLSLGFQSFFIIPSLIDIVIFSSAPFSIKSSVVRIRSEKSFSPEHSDRIEQNISDSFTNRRHYSPLVGVVLSVAIGLSRHLK